MSQDDIEEVRGHYLGYMFESCFRMRVLKAYKGAGPDGEDTLAKEVRALDAFQDATAFLKICDEKGLKPWERSGW